MGLGTSELEYYLLRGGVPPSVASLTGDLTAMEKALVARILQSTSPGLTRNKSGSMGEQLQYLIDIIDNTVAPGDTSLSTGSIAAMIKYLIANPGGGSVFSELGALGKTFPYTNGSTTDLTINGSDQTVAPTNGVLRYRTITFSTAHVLRITGTPCILMVDTIVWNAAGSIRCEASGTPSLGADPAESFPRGGRAFSTGDCVGGYGGGFLIVLAGTVNGSTTGTIRASGTAGNGNLTTAATNTSRGGEGALSTRYSYSSFGPTSQFAAEQWHGSVPGAQTTVSQYVPSFLANLALANGGESTTSALNGGSGGGSGGGAASPPAGGGSGFGGGGGARNATALTVPASIISPNLPQILQLLMMGCRGGGGGAASITTNGPDNSAGGGGGGCVVLIVDVETQVSTLTAAGGAGVNTGATGGAGVTLRQVI